jgi:tetratricopeptide (TPR) repeat protein
VTRGRRRAAAPAGRRGAGGAAALGGRAGRAGRVASLLWLAGILAITFLAYLPSLQNGFTNWDDDLYVTNNPLLASPGFHAILTTPVSGNFHPLTIWSLVLNYRLSGLDPRSYHWLNLLLHLANTALVFFFVRMLSRRRFWTGVVCALVFGIHPMHVESVAWIAERKDVLFAFFYLLGLIAYLRYLDARRIIWLGAALVTFVLSTVSKPAAVVFPLALLATDWFWRRRFAWPVLLEKVPFFGVSLVGGILTLRAQHTTGSMVVQFSVLERVLYASDAIVQYVVKFFVPTGLSAVYPYIRVEGQGMPAKFYLGFAAVLVLLPLTVYLCRKLRPVLFGLLFFFIHVALVLQLVTVGTCILADRYTYLPYIGLTLALAWWLDERPPLRPLGIPVRSVLAGFFLLLLAFSAYETWTRCRVWHDSGTLWNDTLAKYPHVYVDGYLNRGRYYLDDAGRPADALADFDEALRLNPDVARSWNFKGMALMRLGRADSAAVCFDRAVELKPDFAAALNNRGGIRLQRNQTAAAVEDFTRAIAADPKLFNAYANRALAYAREGDREKQVSDLAHLLSADPNDPGRSVYANALGSALQAMGRPREAVDAFDRAIQGARAGDPRLPEYYLNRSASRLALGDRAGARADAEQATRLGATVPPEYRQSLEDTTRTESRRR